MCSVQLKGWVSTRWGTISADHKPHNTNTTRCYVFCGGQQFKHCPLANLAMAHCHHLLGVMRLSSLVFTPCSDDLETHIFILNLPLTTLAFFEGLLVLGALKIGGSNVFLHQQFLWLAANSISNVNSELFVVIQSNVNCCMVRERQVWILCYD